MLKLLLGIVGLVEALYPERFIKLLTKYSYEYDEQPTAKPWVITAARIEGIAILAVVLLAALKDGCDCCGSLQSGDSDDNSSDSAVDRID